MTKRKIGNNQWIWIATLMVFVLAYFYLFDEPTVQTTVLPPTQEVKGSTTETPVVSSSGTWFEVYFTNPVIPFNNNFEGGIEQHLIDKIDTAKTSVDLAVFEFDIETVAEALIRAENRGVVVRVVYDNEYSDPDPQIGELKQVGISTVPDNRSAYMHNKFFIIDNQCVWTGSFNISENAAYRNNENAIYFCSPEAAANYETEFSEMYLGQFGTTSPSDTPFPVFKIDNITIENYFASEDHVMEKVISAVNEANTSIHFMTYSFTDDDLGKLFLSKSNSGVMVEGIFETTGANTKYSECPILLNGGLDVRLDGNPRTFHHKVIIIDGKTVVFGSFNFTVNADTSNDENLLIVHDQNLAMRFEQEYQRMKQQSVIPAGPECKK